MRLIIAWLEVRILLGPPCFPRRPFRVTMGTPRTILSLKDLAPAALAEAADDNMVAHVSWVQQQTAGMRVVVAPGLVLVDCGLPCDTFNVVCRARLAPGNARERVGEAVDHFAR